MFAKFYFSSIIIMALSGCSPGLKSQSGGSKINEQLNLEKNTNLINRIAFLTFEITMTDSIADLYTISLKKSIFADGLLKKSEAGIGISPEPNYLYYQLTKENKQGDSFEKVQNPLFMIYEYPGDNGSLNKQAVRKKSGEFVIRFQYEKALKFISFFKPSTNSKSLKKIYHASL